MADAPQPADATDPHDLARFVQAQEHMYARALFEIESGRKRTHWMWYVFPQYEGLAPSPMASHYAIKSAAEARAYLEHPVLRPRLIECAEALLRIEGRSARRILGSPNDLKLRSCATLFAHFSAEDSVFHRLLKQYFQGRRDEKTLRLLGVLY
jgi:uncharacterized protein (DUF1810 family)